MVNFSTFQGLDFDTPVATSSLGRAATQSPGVIRDLARSIAAP
jgi:hypothetical protein